MTFDQLKLLRLHNQFEYLFDNHHHILVLNALVEILFCVRSLVFLALFVILDYEGRIEDLLLLVPEQVEKQIAWNAKIELLL